MATFDVRVDVSEVTRVIDHYIALGGDLSPAMAIIAQDLVAAVEEQYETEGEGNWDPLAEATLRGRRGGIGKILQDTGIMAGSTAPHHGDFYAEASSDVPYLAFHVEGGEHLPKRNPFELPERVYDEAALTVLEHILRG